MTTTLTESNTFITREELSSKERRGKSTEVTQQQASKFRRTNLCLVRDRLLFLPCFEFNVTEKKCKIYVKKEEKKRF